MKKEVKNDKNSINFKRGLVILVIGIILLLLSLWSMGVFSKNSDALKFYSEYGSNSEISENNLYVYASKEEILNILDHKTGVIYFGFSTCSWCQTVVPILNDVAKEKGYSQIHYYDIKNERDELIINGNGEVITLKNSTAFYREIIKELDDFLGPYILTDSEDNEVDTGQKRIYVPTVVFVKEGQVKYLHEKTVETQEDANDELTSQEKEELKGYFMKGFDLIK